MPARWSPRKTPEHWRPGQRSGRGRTAKVLLEAGTVWALVLLIVGALWTRKINSDDSLRSTDMYLLLRSAVVSSGEVMHREDLLLAPEPPPPAGDPDRIRQLFPPGRTHEILVKGGFTAPLKERDYGTVRRDTLAFLSEMRTSRTIESNDGRRIVAVVHFREARMVKLLSPVDEMRIQLGPPGVPVLDGLDDVDPRERIALLDAEAAAEAILAGGARAVAESPASRAFLEIDSLAGKKVRVTYTDGIGVESIEPLGCALNGSEAQFVFQTAILFDWHLLPEPQTEPGDAWPVDASQLAGLFEPSMRADFQGQVLIRHLGEANRGGNRYSLLGLQGGSLQASSFGYASLYLGAFTPSGTLGYNTSEGFVETARVNWDMDITELWGERLLFETEYRTPPRLAVSYFCKIR